LFNFCHSSCVNLQNHIMLTTYIKYSKLTIFVTIFLYFLLKSFEYCSAFRSSTAFLAFKSTWFTNISRNFVISTSTACTGISLLFSFFSLINPDTNSKSTVAYNLYIVDISYVRMYPISYSRGPGRQSPTWKFNTLRLNLVAILSEICRY